MRETEDFDRVLRRRRWSRRETLLGGMSIAGVVGALFAGVAVATESLAGVSQGLHGARAFFGHGGWRHGHGAPSDEDLDFFVDWTLAKVDASDAQKERARAIVREGHAALREIAEQHRAQRERWADLLGAPTIDRTALESLRQSELQLADAATRRVADDLASVAEVLTPEQRARLVDQVRAWHRERHGEE